ncbi:MAG TPA: hypothetical protein VIR54_04665 [Vicinamibacterales bacterium]|jgi:hypothetical protein
MSSQIERIGNAADQVEHIGVNRTNGVDDAADHPFPLTSVLVLGAVVIGGGILVASMLRDDARKEGLGEFHRPSRLASAVTGMGPRVTEALSRVRDAAISFALTKAIDTVDDMFPGFRDHYERT